MGFLSSFVWEMWCRISKPEGDLEFHHTDSFIFFIHSTNEGLLYASLPAGCWDDNGGQKQISSHPHGEGGTLGRTAPIRFAFWNAQPHLFWSFNENYNIWLNFWNRIP